MSTSQYLDICSVKHCDCHLDRRFAKPHPDIKDGHLCLDHSHLAPEPIADDVVTIGGLDPTETRNYCYSPTSYGVIPWTGATPWTSDQLDRLNSDLFNKQFNKVFEGDL